MLFIRKTSSVPHYTTCKQKITCQRQLKIRKCYFFLFPFLFPFFPLRSVKEIQLAINHVRNYCTSLICFNLFGPKDTSSTFFLENGNYRQRSSKDSLFFSSPYPSTPIVPESIEWTNQNTPREVSYLQPTKIHQEKSPTYMP